MSGQLLIGKVAPPSSDGFGRPARDSSLSAVWSSNYARIAP
jgi:hypothetical protein